MPSVRHNTPDDPLLVRKKGIAGWRRLGEILERIYSRTGIIISVDGLDLQQIPGGVHIDASKVAAAAAAAATHPWKGTMTSTTACSVQGGTLAGNAVATASITTPSTGTAYIYLTVSVSQTITSSYVSSYSITSVTLATASSVPAEDRVGASATYYIPLIKITDAIIVEQYETESLGFRVRDDGTQTGSGAGEYWR